MISFADFKRRAMPQSKTLPGRHALLRWWAKYGMIYPASPISYCLSFTGVSANSVSVSRAVVSLLVVSLFLLSNIYVLLGTIVFVIAYISDDVDGQLARYNGQASLEGSFLDSVTSSVHAPSLWIALALLGYNWSGSIYGLLVVMVLLAVRGMATHAKLLTMMKLKVGGNTALKANDYNDQINSVPEKCEKDLICETPRGFMCGLKIFIRDVRFVMVWFILVVIVSIGLSNNSTAIFVYLSFTLIIQICAEVWRIFRIYRNKEITTFAKCNILSSL